MQAWPAGQANFGHTSWMQVSRGLPLGHFQGFTVTLCIATEVAAALREAVAPSLYAVMLGRLRAGSAIAVFGWV